MGFWSSIMGRSQPAAPRLDSLFAVPSAALTLEAGLGLVPTGIGSVCYRAASGAGFAQTQQEAVALLGSAPEAPDVEVTVDDFGFTWLTVTHDPSDTSGLCTDLHAVNSTLGDAGFGPGLLCSLVVFADVTGRRVGLVYLYKQGTFYPFAPQPTTGSARGAQVRDTLMEIQVRDAVENDLPLEEERSRWLAVWGAPGL
ncbi:PspA-associated protein PspAB [Nocardioides sp. AX2bis]|uniref:PspA-associated protein PspAB n=1 Tax=Nocardioides sp. AX2bis TaxID=2653157 RepID=UPI0012F2F31E|nr:hypothetical protein [Nocardioides sp. AX2bis]VXB74188.1 conserved hypothetical protein [Nocardioides sp. AX2bis]